MMTRSGTYVLNKKKTKTILSDFWKSCLRFLSCFCCYIPTDTDSEVQELYLTKNGYQSIERLESPAPPAEKPFLAEESFVVEHSSSVLLTENTIDFDNLSESEEIMTENGSSDHDIKEILDEVKQEIVVEQSSSVVLIENPIDTDKLSESAETISENGSSDPDIKETLDDLKKKIVVTDTKDDASLSETASSSPMLHVKSLGKSATPSPVSQGSRKEIGTKGSQEWHSNEDDIERLVAIHTTRSSLSSLGLRSDSMASVYSGAGEGRYGIVTVRGQIEFGLQYNYKASSLEILIKQCKDLASVDAKRNRSDPYVKVYLLPDKSKSGKRKTKVKKHTLNPIFEECLKFHISLTGLETRTLWLTVWHSDMFGRNDFLGEVMMTLENKVFDDPTPKWYNLQERTEPFEDVLSFRGDILVGLKFVPPDMTVVKKGKRSRGALHVKVKEAKSLTAVKSNGTSDPFCKSYLLPDKGRTSKQKTAVIRKTVNAVWNHTFVYDDVTMQELAERCLELTVWDHDRLGSNEFLGGVRFSLGEGKHFGKTVDWMDSTGKEVSLWKSMLERPNFWVEGCLPLRPTLDHRTTS